MRNDLTDLTIVLDRSGSMQACREEAENGLNHFIHEQRHQNGDCHLTLVQFDTEYEFVHRAVPIGEVPHCTLVPRGLTALLDAVGRTIHETSMHLAGLDEDQRPGLVAFVILTDGLENSSSDFTKKQIRQMIERRQQQHDWQFTFLGAHQDAFAEARGIGIAPEATAAYSASAPDVAFAAASMNVQRMRRARATGGKVLCAFTEAERASMRPNPDTEAAAQ